MPFSENGYSKSSRVLRRELEALNPVGLADCLDVKIANAALGLSCNFIIN